MKENTVIDFKSPVDALSELIRTGARQFIYDAVEAEFDAFLDAYYEKLPNGKRRIVKNGHLPEREIMTGIGKVSVRVPRVRDRGESKEKIKFQSAFIPPYMRRTATIDEMLPLLYLKGISERDFVEVLRPIFGNDVNNLSPSVISRLKAKWEDEYSNWNKRDLSDKKYVYWWVDGVHFTGRLDDKQCVLVVMGVTEFGNKELIAIRDGYRESTDSWSTLLRELRDRKINSPMLAVGDGALGFWNAINAVFPNTKHQRCWFHKSGNVLDKLPKSQQPKAKSMLQEIWMAATRADAYTAFEAFIEEYEAKYPRATDCLKKDKEEMLAFYDFPAEHWVHIRTTNAIESVFATVRNRTYKSKGAFSATTILMMTFKLMQSAEKRFIKLRGFHHLENVIRGVKFVDGKINKDNADLLNSFEAKSDRIAA